MIYNSLQLREIFHLEFLRWMNRKVKAEFYAVKGGVNLRFFFKSIRYSEDMDLDVHRIEVEPLKESVMKILNSSSFQENLIPFGINEVVSPDIAKAKQTETTQRFKVHLHAASGEELFTKIEFSRRGIRGRVVIQPVSSTILREYKLPPLIAPHYDIQSAIVQKFTAITRRNITQPRDIFDLYVLIPQYNPDDAGSIEIDKTDLKSASEKILEVGFEEFRDAVVSYLPHEEQSLYSSPALWDDIKLRVVGFLDGFKH